MKKYYALHLQVFGSLSPNTIPKKALKSFDSIKERNEYVKYNENKYGQLSKDHAIKLTAEQAKKYKEEFIYNKKEM
ncbi:MAG: hypothetical protein FWC41_00075 [Firmicutes bacterium]|nr:hypothetical protein [Bacillota bacterium]